MRIFTVIFILFLSNLSFAHEFEGKVVDQDDKPIEYVQVSILGSVTHTHTNKLGEFELHGVEKGDTLVISHLGFKSQK